MNYIQRAKKFNTKKRLGQNFLVDESVLDYIICAAGEIENTTVLEIGPGIGFLTEKLCKNAKEVIACEIDDDAINFLNKNLLPSNKNLKLIHNDILKTDISALSNEKVKVVANIPYYITAPIISHLLGEIDDLNNKNRNSISEIILMVQEEVARRMVATEKSPSKQYGLLTILAQFWTDCEIIRLVGRKSFFPAPKVNSALVGLKINNEPKLKLSDYSHFRRVLKAAFSQRRKNIKNCLVNNGFNKDIVKSVLNKLDIDENTRGESLSIEKFGQLSEELKNANQN